MDIVHKHGDWCNHPIQDRDTPLEGKISYFQPQNACFQLLLPQVVSFEHDGDLYVRVDDPKSWSVQHLCCLRSLPFAAGKDVILLKSLSSVLCHVEYSIEGSDSNPPHLPLNLCLFSLRGTHAICIMSSTQCGVLTTFWPLPTTDDSFFPLVIGPTEHQVQLFRAGIQHHSPMFTAIGSGTCVLIVADATDTLPGAIRLVRYSTQTESISVRKLPFPSYTTKNPIKSIALDDHLGVVYFIMGRNLVSLAFS